MTVRAGTAAAWALLAIDAVLDDATISYSDGLSVLIGCVAVAGSLVLAGWARARPVYEVYELGFEAGRRQAKVDAAMEQVSRSDGVVPFRSRRSG